MPGSGPVVDFRHPRSTEIHRDPLRSRLSMISGETLCAFLGVISTAQKHQPDLSESQGIPTQKQLAEALPQSLRRTLKTYTLVRFPMYLPAKEGIAQVMIAGQQLLSFMTRTAWCKADADTNWKDWTPPETT